MVSTVRCLVSDPTGQTQPLDLQADWTLRQHTPQVLRRLGLPDPEEAVPTPADRDGGGMPLPPDPRRLSYRWINETRGALLPESATVSSAIAQNDAILILPEPVAGSACRPLHGPVRRVAGSASLDFSLSAGSHA